MSSNEDADRLARGEQARRRVMGDAHVSRSMGATSPSRSLFEEYLTGAAWADVWDNDDLDQDVRSLVTVGLLAAGGHERQLELHMRAAAEHGVPAEQVAQVLLHVGIYAGLPAANLGFHVLDRIYEAVGRA